MTPPPQQGTACFVCGSPFTKLLASLSKWLCADHWPRVVS